MKYRIEYDGGRVKKRFIRVTKGKKWSIITMLAAIVLCSTLLWPRGRILLRDFVLPGDPAVTDHALQTLVEDLRHGQSMSDAVEVFCKEIIDGVEP